MKDFLLIKRCNETGNGKSWFMAGLLIIRVYATRCTAMCNRLPYGKGQQCFKLEVRGSAVRRVVGMGLCFTPGNGRRKCQRAQTIATSTQKASCLNRGDSGNPDPIFRGFPYCFPGIC